MKKVSYEVPYIFDIQRVFITFTNGFPEAEVGAAHLRQKQAQKRVRFCDFQNSVGQVSGK